MSSRSAVSEHLTCLVLVSQHDVLATFPKLARVMYNAAKDEKYPQLSPIICQALVNIITPYIAGERAVENDDGTQDNTGDAKIMVRAGVWAPYRYSRLGFWRIRWLASTRD